MTNKEGIVMYRSKDEGDEGCASRLAALLAVHLVGQVLDEAYVIATAATESGQPWDSLSMMKNLRSDKVMKNDKDISCVTSKVNNLTFIDSKRDDAEIRGDKADVLSNLVVTSTPQKKSDAMAHNITENNSIGQGDEEPEKASNNTTNFTSNYINHLFDMSELEKIIFCDDNLPTYRDSIPIFPEANSSSLQDVTVILESYVNAALCMALIKESQENKPEITINSSRSTNQSCYSFLSDAFVVDMGKVNAFYIDDGESNVKETSVEPTIEEVTLKRDIKINEDGVTEEINNALCENVYLTLNRDYEQGSEYGDPVFQDLKGVSLQEVELMTAHTSEENLSLVYDRPQNCKELAVTSAISGSESVSRKSSLFRRCRTQGARLLACLRGWWKRKTPGRRKDSRVPGSIRGLCPLSPDARRRAASTLDQRHLRSPSPSRCVYKFNTINEALVNSSRWKEYTFDVKPDEYGDR